jgi:phage FluMu protein Com
MSQTTVSINCPTCKKLIAQSLAPLKSGISLRCPGCGTVNRYVGEDQSKLQILIGVFGADDRSQVMERGSVGIFSSPVRFPH